MEEPLQSEDQTELSNADVVTTVFMEEDRLQERGVGVASSLGEGAKRDGGGGEEEEGTEGMSEGGDGGKGVMGGREEGEERGGTERVCGRGGGKDQEEKGDKQTREEVIPSEFIV